MLIFASLHPLEGHYLFSTSYANAPNSAHARAHLTAYNVELCVLNEDKKEAANVDHPVSLG